MFGLPCGRWSNTNIGSFHYIVFALKNAELYSVIFCIASPHMPLRAKPKYSILLYKWAYTALWLQSCDVVCAESSRRYESLDKKIIISWKKTVTFVNLLFRYRTEKKIELLPLSETSTRRCIMSILFTQRYVRIWRLKTVPALKKMYNGRLVTVT